jgi:hypothetical protein
MRVALPRIRLNEGSLLRRTLLHVATFVLGSMAFIGVVSLVLVSVAKSLVPPRPEAAEEEVRAVASAPKLGPMAPVARPNRPGRRTATVPTTPPSKDD